MRANFISMRGVAIGTVSIFKNVENKNTQNKNRKKQWKHISCKNKAFFGNSNLNLEKKG